jgi:hypothetical protein
VSTPEPEHASTITAVLLQITAHAERLAALDQREADRYQALTSQLGQLVAQLADARDGLRAVQAETARNTAVLDALDGLDEHVATLAGRVAQLARHAGMDGSDGYQPVPAPRWWALEGEEREEALARLRAWVEQVYRPGYGHLSAALGGCWEQHPLCLYGLDWLMELWSALYLTPERQAGTLGSQGEWQARLLPALAAQMNTETVRCQHARGLPLQQPRPACLPQQT